MLQARARDFRRGAVRTRPEVVCATMKFTKPSPGLIEEFRAVVQELRGAEPRKRARSR
jgi:hypothetical protein